MDRFTDDGKLGQGFTSADDLVEVDIGNGDKPRPTFISAKLNPECKQQLTDIKAEITKLIEAKFIWQCRYAEWIPMLFQFTRRMGSFEFALISGILINLRRWMVTQCQLPIC